MPVLVEGPSPELTRETADLLRSRLRIAALLLLAGFVAFLPRHYFRSDFSQPLDVWLFAFHLAGTASLGLVAAALCRQCRLLLWQLRSAEWLIFGLPAVFFAATQYEITLALCRQGLLNFPDGLWLSLIYIYALFIPNTVWRAAVAIAAMCVSADGPAAGNDLVVSAGGRVRHGRPLVRPGARCSAWPAAGASSGWA